MFCSKCGAKAVDGAEFCQKCGAKFIAFGDQMPKTVQTDTVLKGTKSTSSGTERAQKQKKNKILPIILGALGGLIVLIILLSSLGGNSDSVSKAGNNGRSSGNTKSDTVSGTANVGGVNLSQTYSNEEDGLSFQYPGGWKPVGRETLSNLTEGTELGELVALFANEIEDLPQENSYILVSKFVADQDMIDHLFIDDEQFAATFDNAVSIKDTSIVNQDGVPVRKITYFDPNTGLGYESYFYAAGSWIYRIDFNWMGENPGDNQRFFDAIISTLTITNSEKVTGPSSTGISPARTGGNEVAGEDANINPQEELINKILTDGVVIASKDIIRNPSNYVGQYVNMIAVCEWDMNGHDKVYAADITDTGKYFENISEPFYIYDRRTDDSFKVLQNDVVQICGIVTGVEDITF